MGGPRSDFRAKTPARSRANFGCRICCPRVWHKLEKFGINSPKAETVNPQIGYSSRIYQIPNLHLDWKRLYIQMNSPKYNRSGVIIPIEGNRWIVTLIGSGSDYPPKTNEGFLAYA